MSQPNARTQEEETHLASSYSTFSPSLSEILLSHTWVSNCAGLSPAPRPEAIKLITKRNSASPRHVSCVVTGHKRSRFKCISDAFRRGYLTSNNQQGSRSEVQRSNLDAARRADVQPEKVKRNEKRRTEPRSRQIS